MPWILDVGYTVMCVALMLAVMGHILFGDFEVTMVTLPDSISGRAVTYELPGPEITYIHTVYTKYACITKYTISVRVCEISKYSTENRKYGV